MMMRRYIYSILVLLLFVVSGSAKPVTKAEVSEAVYELLTKWNQPQGVKIAKIEPQYSLDGTLVYYLVDLGQGGWVVVSGDDVVRPVLAFSFENRLNALEQWADAATYLLNIYKEEIHFAAKNPDLKRDAGWERQLLPSQKSTDEDIYIDPIIEVTWNQDAGWNMFCPNDEDGPGNHAYVGCVAVAMSQAMSVYNYPASPVGMKSYFHEDYGSITVDYNKADPYEWDQMGSGSYDSSNAILLYHSAVAVEMGFGGDGSGAYVRTAASAMKQYFSYSTNLSFENRMSDDDQWEALLVDELKAGRPIIYRGTPGDGTAGHAWNVDGYGAGYFHMNFGWSGKQNGYYTLDLINPGSNDFSSDQGAMIGIAPPVSAPYGISLSAEVVDEGLPVGAYVAAVTVEDEDPNNIYSFTCKGKYNIILDDYRPASFYIDQGKLYTDKVLTYNEERPELNSEFLLILVEDQYGSKFQKEFFVTIKKTYSGPVGIALSDSSVIENQPVGTVVGRLLIEDENTTNTYTYTLSGPYNQEIPDFDPPSFYVENDSLKTSVSFDLDKMDSCYVLVDLEDSFGFQLSQAFMIRIKSDQSGSTPVISVTLENDLVYPNPASSYITLRNSEQITSIDVHEISTGRVVIHEEIVAERVDVSGLAEGLYLVVIHSKSGIFAQKLLISF